MWKYIIIMILVLYVLNKIGSMIFRITRQAPPPRPGFRRPPDGSINVESMPKKGKKGGLKGGEYVDYEEIK